MVSFYRWKKHLVFFSFSAFVYLGSLFCQGFEPQTPRPAQGYNGPNPYAGSASCKNCHEAIYKTHTTTAHYQDSRPPLEKFIKGSFDTARNIFKLNPFTDVFMDKTDSGFFQTAYVSEVFFRSEAFGLVIGSGRKGQTYLYWRGNTLFQLPISYYTPLDSWCNSPGYSTAMAYFNKAITGQCLECHSTYVKTAIDPAGVTSFDSSSLIYGIDCERCHGPSAAHVAFQQANPGEKTARFVINPRTLTRNQQLDACALCHSGFRKEKKPPFTFQEGDKLDDFSTAPYDDKTTASLDVHGNQYGLLTSSKCFKSSSMNCSSCHHVHQTELNEPGLFSSRCMNCHQEHGRDTCTFIPPKGLALRDNCIDCHMPRLPSKKIFLQMDDPRKSTADLVRTHRIAIYPDITKLFLASRGFKTK